MNNPAGTKRITCRQCGGAFFAPVEYTREVCGICLRPDQAAAVRCGVCPLLPDRSVICTRDCAEAARTAARDRDIKVLLDQVAWNIHPEIRQSLDGLARLAREARDERDRAQRNENVMGRRAEDAERGLLNLLARIHRDGGQYTEEYGLERSIEEAHVLSAERIQKAEADPGGEGLREALLLIWRAARETRTRSRSSDELLGSIEIMGNLAEKAIACYCASQIAEGNAATAETQMTRLLAALRTLLPVLPRPSTVKDQNHPDYDGTGSEHYFRAWMTVMDALGNATQERRKEI